MLIHIGNNEFIDFHHCEAIMNLETIDEESKKRILASMPAYMRVDARAAILTTEGKWIASTISSEALAHRGICHHFQNAAYLKKTGKKVPITGKSPVKSKELTR